MTTPSDNPVMHDLELEVDAELSLAESSSPEDGVPVAEWQFDPTEVEREEIGLRTLRDALEALESEPRHNPAGRS